MKTNKGKVVRVDQETWEYICSCRKKQEKITKLMRRLVLRPVKYVLPDDLFESIEDARGQSIIRNLKVKKRKADEPIEVFI